MINYEEELNGAQLDAVLAGHLLAVGQEHGELQTAEAVGIGIDDVKLRFIGMFHVQ